jgi:hypothetical protein
MKPEATDTSTFAIETYYGRCPELSHCQRLTFGEVCAIVRSAAEPVTEATPDVRAIRGFIYASEQKLSRREFNALTDWIENESADYRRVLSRRPLDFGPMGRHVAPKPSATIITSCYEEGKVSIGM